MTEYESIDQTEETKPEKLLLENSEPILLNTDTPIDDQLKEINHSLIDRFRKPCEKTTTRRSQDNIIELIKKEREERLAALREMKQQDCNDPIQIFFKSMALTVATFPLEMAVEAKTRVFNIISEMELRLLKEKSNITKPFYL